MILICEPSIEVFWNTLIPSPYSEIWSYGFFEIRFSYQAILKYSSKKWNHNICRDPSSTRIFVTPHIGVYEDTISIKKNMFHY